ncbi:MAG: S8 family peptidase [Arcicella sp.]|jgi:hypothetical protein|nr:S8 family peptidase [Arcicella sp.]
MKRYTLLLFSISILLGMLKWGIVEDISIESSHKLNPNSESTSGGIKFTDFSLNGITKLKTDYPELDGSEIGIVQKEHRPDLDDIDIKNNITTSSLESTETTLHATQVASIMVSNGISSPLNEGIAPKAKLFSVSFNNLNPEKDAFYLNNRISIVNNSFGTNLESFYGQNASEYDAVCLRQPDLLFLFSSGNIGNSNSLTGKYANIPNFANLSGNYKMAKNILTVGAINQYGELASNSSRGPAYDGRIKPEIVAFSNNGTSEATALVSGATALFQQAFQKKMSKIPSSALTKAILINSADDVGNKGPDFSTGFGSLNIVKAVETVKQQHFWESNLINNEQKAITITIPENISLFKVTLCWTDPPAINNATTALVNNLDLTLSTNSPSFTIWQPWVLNSSPNPDSLKKLPTRKRDFLNNIEQITLEKPRAGVYKILVYGEKVSTAKQNFSVAYQWEYTNSFEWLFPLQNTKIVANSTTNIRWQNTHTDTQGQLSYSSDGGKIWRVIADKVDLQKGYYEWETPSIFGKILLRITTNNRVFMSKTFTISPILELNAHFFCTDSTQLHWRFPYTNNNIKYNVFRFDKKTFTWLKVATTAQSSITLQGNFKHDFFSVEPLGESELTGIRSDFISAKSSGTDCFFNSFTASLEEDKAFLNVNLSSLVGLKSITFQKILSSIVKDMKTIPITPTIQSYQAIDEQLTEGINQYQLRINFLNGKSIYTDTRQVFYSENQLFWVYPTPISSDELLKIENSSQETFQLSFYTLSGQLINEFPIYTGHNQLPLSGFPSGNYLYLIHSPQSSQFQKGKITIKP